MEVESFEAGTLIKIVVPPKVNVPVQSTVGFLGAPGEPIPAVTAPAPAPKKAAAAPAAAAPAPAASRSSAPAAASMVIAAPVAPTAHVPTAPKLFRISPRAA